jgi:hypothetical protein
MNPNNPYTMALSEGQYVPHAYSFRRLHGYERPANVGRTRPRSVPGSAYDLIPMAPVMPRNEGPQTVEQVIEQGYFAVPNSQPEIAIIDDKKCTAWLGLDAVTRFVLVIHAACVTGPTTRQTLFKMQAGSHPRLA